MFKEECQLIAIDNIVLVGTKLDDIDNRVVRKEDAENLCRSLGIQNYYETSA